MWAPSTSASVMTMTLLVAQVLARGSACRCRSRAPGPDRRAAGSARACPCRRDGDVEDLAAQRQDRLAGAVARLLGRAAGGVALDDEDLRALRRCIGAVGELAGQAQLARRASCAAISFSWRRRRRSSACSTTSRAAWSPARGLPASQWSNGSLTALSTMRVRLGGGEPVLGLALEFGLADEHRQHRARRRPSRRRLVTGAARLPWPMRSA